MGTLGFNRVCPQNWNKPWLLMWLVFTAGLIALAFFVPFWPFWLLASAALFFVPEVVSISKKNDAFPPLTHTIRHFVPNWVAFPSIYFCVGAIGSRALGFPRPLHVGALFAVLGWLTDHFIGTYSRDDPFPFSKRSRRALPAREEPERLVL